MATLPILGRVAATARCLQVSHSVGWVSTSHPQSVSSAASYRSSVNRLPQLAHAGRRASLWAASRAASTAYFAACSCAAFRSCAWYSV